MYAICLYPTVDFKVFSGFVIVCFADAVSLTFFPLKSEGSKQKIN